MIPHVTGQLPAPRYFLESRLCCCVSVGLFILPAAQCSTRVTAPDEGSGCQNRGGWFIFQPFVYIGICGLSETSSFFVLN